MNTIKLLFSSILVSLILQGCGENDSTISTYSTTLGEGVSVTTTDENAVMAPNSLTLKDIGTEVGNIIKTNVIALNIKEAIIFSKETNYCDVSGLLESENIGTMEKLYTISNYKNCKTEYTLQNGKIKINYKNMDSDGKFPKNIHLTIIDNYTFNEIELKKDLTIESSIVYNKNQEIQSISSTINGNLTYKYGSYMLKNITQTVNY